MWATLLTLGLLLGVNAAHAADACFRDSLGDIAVFKRFRMPRPGDCLPIHGHQHFSHITLDGTACGESEGGWVGLRFHYITDYGEFGHGSFTIYRSTNSGFGRGCDANIFGSGWRCSSITVEKVDCPRPTIVD